MKIIKVIHLARTFGVGGLEQVIKYLLLHSYDRIQPSACVIRRAGKFSKEVEKEGIKIKSFDAEPRRITKLRLMMEMVTHFLQEKPDIIHCHDLQSWFFGTTASRLTGKRAVVMTKHGGFDGENLSSILQARLCSYGTSRIIAVSPGIKDEMAERIGIPRSKVDVIYNGIDIGQYKARKPRQEAKKRIGIDPTRFVAGTVTRYYPVKNVEMQVDMVERVRHEIPSIAYLIVAPLTEYGKKIQADIERRGLKDNIYVLGYRDDIPDILNALDVFVLSSFSEGTSIALLEAMAAGCIVVASNTGGTPLILEDGYNGYLFNVHDIDEMCRTIVKGYRESMKQNGIKNGSLRSVERYSLQAMVDEYEKLYLTLLHHT